MKLIALAMTLSMLVMPLKTWAGATDFEVLCYHDVSKNHPGDAYGVTLEQLQTQFDFLQKHYTVVSLDDVISASQGKKKLPEKAVLITFDDGLASFYDLVYPLLKRYKFPAVFAVVGKWIEEGKAPDYGYVGVNPPMTSWKQLKEMSDSGLVAIVSHSYNLHKGHVFNPQGNEQASAGFLNFNLELKAYETEAEFLARVKADLAQNDQLIRKNIGKNYPVMVWPYGSYNGLSKKAATEVGLPIQFSIDKGNNHIGDLSYVRRSMILSHFSNDIFAKGLTTSFVYEAPVRAISVDLDPVWSGTEDQSIINLGKLNDKAAAVRPNLALIQSFSAKGEAYFPTSEVPVKANFFPRVAHVLQNRSRIEKVYALLPAKYLKDKKKTELLIHDLAIYSDIDGIFFDTRSPRGKRTDKHIELAMKTGAELRSGWSFGIIGPLPSIGKDKFKYIIKDFYWGSASNKLAKTVGEFQNPHLIVALAENKNVSVPEQYKKIRDLGLNNFFLPLSFNSYSDVSFLKTNFQTEINPYSVP